jgi:hypothetical protein
LTELLDRQGKTPMIAVSGREGNFHRRLLDAGSYRRYRTSGGSVSPIRRRPRSYGLLRMESLVKTLRKQVW